MQVLDITEADLDAVLALNEASVPHVSHAGIDQMRWFAASAEYFRVVRFRGSLAGFLIGLGPGLEYTSENYRWFSENYEDFAYIDRVAVDAAARRLGIATRLYEDFASTLRGDVPYLACEVNTRPPNEPSMRFHENRGFVRVASQETEGGTKEVALLVKKL